MKRLILATMVTAALIGVVIAQQNKPLAEWSKNEAENILNHSAWGQTQTETDTSEMVYSPTRSGTASAARSEASRGRVGEQQSINNDRAERGATNQAVSVNYHVRLLSAKPVRLALRRLIELTQKDRDNELMEGLDSFVTRDFSKYIVVAVTLDSSDARFSGPVLQTFASAALSTFKNKAYLERKDGKRVFVMEYHAPINDGLGAKFIFPRMVDERVFLDRDSGSVRFYCEVTAQLELNVTFKVADMIYDGKLEY